MDGVFSLPMTGTASQPAQRPVQVSAVDKVAGNFNFEALKGARFHFLEDLLCALVAGRSYRHAEQASGKAPR